MRRFTRTRTRALAEHHTLLPSTRLQLRSRTHNTPLITTQTHPPLTPYAASQIHPWIGTCRGFTTARGKRASDGKVRPSVAVFGGRGAAGALGLVVAGLGMALLGSHPVMAHEKERSSVVVETEEEEVEIDDEEDEVYGSEKDPKSILAAASSRPNYSDGSQFYIPPAIDSKMKLFSGNGNWHLANEISMHLGVQLGRATVNRYADGEVAVNIHDNVRGKDVFVIQPLAPPVNENLMELLLMITTLRRASARKITAVIPYFGYSRSTKKDTGRVPIAAADVAKMLQVAGADRVIAVDLHNAQIQGFFGPKTPVDNLDVSGIAIPYFETKFLREPVVVSPDANGAPRAKAFRDKLIRHNIQADLAVIVDHSAKDRGWQLKSSDNFDNEISDAEIDAMELVGSVKGRDCVIYDDMVDSAGRITKGARKLKKAGARRVFAFSTHGLFLGNAYERIEKSELIEVVCVNTLPLQTTNVGGVSSWSYCSKVHQLSCGALLAEAIRRIHQKQSLSDLMGDTNK